MCLSFTFPPLCHQEDILWVVFGFQLEILKLSFETENKIIRDNLFLKSLFEIFVNENTVICEMK